MEIVGTVVGENVDFVVVVGTGTGTVGGGEAADVDGGGDVAREARGELAEVLEFESRGFELERALIAGLDDGSVGEGPEVAPAELSGVLVSVSADEFGSAVGFRHGRALDLALWRAQFKDDVAFSLHGLTNDARPIVGGVARDGFVRGVLVDVGVEPAAVSSVVRALRRALRSIASDGARHLAHDDVGELFVLVRSRSVFHLSHVGAASGSLGKVTPRRKAILAV